MIRGTRDRPRHGSPPRAHLPPARPPLDRPPYGRLPRGRALPGRRPPDHGPADRGTVAMFTAIFALFVIVLAGLLVDGGLAVHARERAADIAEQGARAAADEVDVGHLRRTGQARITDARTACLRAQRLVAAYPEVTGPAQCRIEGGRVARVTVRIRVRLQLLGIVPGFGDFTMTSSASARPQEGI